MLSVSYMLAVSWWDNGRQIFSLPGMGSYEFSLQMCYLLPVPNCSPDVLMILMARNVVLMFSEHIRPERDGSPVRAQAATGGQVL